MVTAGSEGLRADALWGSVRAQRVGHFPLEVLEDGERHAVDDRRAVQGVDGLDARSPRKRVSRRRAWKSVVFEIEPISR